MPKPTTLRDETNKGDGGWFPQIIFEPQVQGPRNRSGEEDVLPTPYYDIRYMSKFRSNPAPGDIESIDGEEPGSSYAPEQYKDQKSTGRNVFGGKAKQNPWKDRKK